MNRVGIVRIKRAYVRTGLKPVSGEWIAAPAKSNDAKGVCRVWDGKKKYRDGQACPLGAVAIAESVTKLLHERGYGIGILDDEIVADHLDLSPAYIDGFTSAVDGAPRGVRRGQAALGYADGKAAREALHIGEDEEEDE